MDEARMAQVFAEWERRYRQEPEKFISEQQRAGIGTGSYGELCVKTFNRIKRELFGEE